MGVGEMNKQKLKTALNFILQIIPAIVSIILFVYCAIIPMINNIESVDTLLTIPLVYVYGILFMMEALTIGLNKTNDKLIPNFIGLGITCLIFMTNFIIFASSIKWW